MSRQDLRIRVALRRQAEFLELAELVKHQRNKFVHMAHLARQHVAELAGKAAVAGSELGVLRHEAAEKAALLLRVQADAGKARGRRDASSQALSRCARAETLRHSLDDCRGMQANARKARRRRGSGAQALLQCACFNAGQIRVIQRHGVVPMQAPCGAAHSRAAHGGAGERAGAPARNGLVRLPGNGCREARVCCTGGHHTLQQAAGDAPCLLLTFWQYAIILERTNPSFCLA